MKIFRQNKSKIAEMLQRKHIYIYMYLWFNLAV